VVNVRLIVRVHNACNPTRGKKASPRVYNQDSACSRIGKRPPRSHIQVDGRERGKTFLPPSSTLVTGEKKNGIPLKWYGGAHPFQKGGGNCKEMIPKSQADSSSHQRFERQGGERKKFGKVNPKPHITQKKKSPGSEWDGI